MAGEAPDGTPLGAMGNVVDAQAAISCNPDTGLFSYRIPNLQLTPAVLKAKAGRFLWDVVLVKFEPYTIYPQPGIRLFELLEE